MSLSPLDQPNDAGLDMRLLHKNLREMEAADAGQVSASEMADLKSLLNEDALSKFIELHRRGNEVVVSLLRHFVAEFQTGPFLANVTSRVINEFLYTIVLSSSKPEQMMEMSKNLSEISDVFKTFAALTASGVPRETVAGYRKIIADRKK